MAAYGCRDCSPSGPYNEKSVSWRRRVCFADAYNQFPCIVDRDDQLIVGLREGSLNDQTKEATCHSGRAYRVYSLNLSTLCVNGISSIKAQIFVKASGDQLDTTRYSIDALHRYSKTRKTQNGR